MHGSVDLPGEAGVLERALGEDETSGVGSAGAAAAGARIALRLRPAA